MYMYVYIYIYIYIYIYTHTHTYIIAFAKSHSQEPIMVIHGFCLFVGGFVVLPCCVACGILVP